MDPSKFRLVVTSGPTREWMDPVRFISNPSSGRTGWSIASKGLKLFSEVIYICGPGHVRYLEVQGAKNIPVDTTEDMLVAVKKSIRNRTVLIMAAAPADFAPVLSSLSKIKKNSGKLLHLNLRPTVDILKSLDELNKKDFYRIGFAAETDHISENAIDKLKRKNLDYICANQVFKENQGFGEHDNTLHVMGRDGSVYRVGPGNKVANAGKLLKYLIQKLP